MTLTLLIFLLFNIPNLNAQRHNSIKKLDKVNSIYFDTMGDIFIIQYGRKNSDTNELIIGLSYTNPKILNIIQYPGTEQIFTLELGYRLFLWKNLHAEIQIDPQYFNCKDTSAQKPYNGFGLTPEIRFGYRFDFTLRQIP